MKKIYQNPSFMVVALNTRHSILGTSGDDPQPPTPVDPSNSVGDDSPNFTKGHNVWDDDWD